MSSRRPHTKSRRGCIQCKKQKTKCDEFRPGCAKCDRRGARCSFLDGDSSLVILTTSQPHVTSKRRRGGAEHDSTITATRTKGTSSEAVDKGYFPLSRLSAGSSFRDDERDNLRLMYHYTRYTSETISEPSYTTKERLSIWRDHVPKLAFEHEFLLHGLLAVASLHLALCCPSRQHDHAVLALRHHNTALALFRPHLSNITRNNVGALFAFSCLVPLYSFGIHRTSQSNLRPLSKIHEVFTLVRGIAIVVKSGIHWLEQGPFGDVWLPQPANPSRKLRVEVEDVLAELSRRSHKTVVDTTLANVLTTAIAILRHSFLLADEQPDAKMTVVLFPIMVPPEFATLVRQCEPMALVILANYAVILHWLSEHVWLEGWGKQVVDAVDEALPQEWRECIAWAVREVEGGSSTV